MKTVDIKGKLWVINAENEKAELGDWRGAVVKGEDNRSFIMQELFQAACRDDNTLVVKCEVEFSVQTIVDASALTPLTEVFHKMLKDELFSDFIIQVLLSAFHHF